MVKDRICPKCKSKNVKEDIGAFQFAIKFTQQKFICNDCGYEGIFPEIN